MTTKQSFEQEVKLPRLDTYFWAGALIWMGLIFGAESLDYLPRIGTANAWSWIFLGAGLLGFVLNFYSMSSSHISNPTGWDWVWSVVFLLVGAGGFITLNIPGWLILIVIGAAVLVSETRRRE